MITNVVLLLGGLGGPGGSSGGLGGGLPGGWQVTRPRKLSQSRKQKVWRYKILGSLSKTEARRF